jgi:hypothetical protein
MGTPETPFVLSYSQPYMAYAWDYKITYFTTLDKDTYQFYPEVPTIDHAEEHRVA